MPRIQPRRDDVPVHLYCGGRIWSPGSVTSMALAEQGGRLLALGAREELLRRYPNAACTELDGRLVTSGLIDCHTHLVYAGDRSAEIERRLAGESYAAIARSGGGILATVSASRAADLGQLVSVARARLEPMLAEGVTTVEIKSGYGLDLDSEIRLLQAARTLGEECAVSVSRTYLGAHVVPTDSVGGADGYVTRVCEEYLPAVAAGGWADAFDAYCEEVAFSVAQVERLFHAARALGFKLKLHADQLSNLGGAALAARFGALSADHLEYTDAAGVAALAGSGTVAVLLPGAYYFLRQDQPPPIDALRRAAVPMAVATDSNPGTSPLTSLLTAMNLAALEFGLSVDECLDGVTRQAARALGLGHECGQLLPGFWCDLAIWDVTQPAELVLSLGRRPLHQRIWRGQPDRART